VVNGPVAAAGLNSLVQSGPSHAAKLYALK
jgi:hypothetical protein